MGAGLGGAWLVRNQEGSVCSRHTGNTGLQTQLPEGGAFPSLEAGAYVRGQLPFMVSVGFGEKDPVSREEAGALGPSPFHATVFRP